MPRNFLTAAPVLVLLIAALAPRAEAESAVLDLHGHQVESATFAGATEAAALESAYADASTRARATCVSNGLGGFTETTAVEIVDGAGASVEASVVVGFSCTIRG